LEYNGTDLRHATAEEAAYELAKPADKVEMLAQYRLDRKLAHSDTKISLSRTRRAFSVPLGIFSSALLFCDSV